MSPVDPNAGRHFGGRGEAPGAWTCPTCGAKNAGPVGEGCGSCGAGGAVANAAAAARVEAEKPVSGEEMHRTVYTTEEGGPFENVGPCAQSTLIHALEFYLAQGVPQKDDLSMAVTRAWLTSLLEPEVRPSPSAADVAHAAQDAYDNDDFDNED